MKPLLIIFLIVLIIRSMAITPDEILKTSRDDIEEALKMLQVYIKENPEDPKIENLGRVLYAKLALRDTVFADISQREDISGLIEKIASLEKPLDPGTFKLLRIVFPNLDKIVSKGLENLDLTTISACRKMPGFLKMSDSNFSENLLNAYLSSSTPLNIGRLQDMRCILDYEKVTSKLIEGLKTYMEKGENFYMKVYYTAKSLGLSTRSLDDLERYADLMTKLETIDSSSTTLRDYERLLREYLSLRSEKNMIKMKLQEIASSLSYKGYDLSRLCDDPDICPKGVGREVEHISTNNKLVWYIVLSVVAISAVLYSAFLRLRNPKVKVKRLKKKISKDPLNADLHLKLARIYEELGLMEEAMKEYKVASDIVSSDSD